MTTMSPPNSLRADVKKYIIDPIVGGNMVDSQTKYHINPTGRFVIGGPHGDTGLTGRKIIVDTYGGMGRHGGGAFSGKDPTKVDRSACYMARYVAKNIVAAGLASRVEVQLAYAIGVAEPVSVMVNTFGTGTVPEERLVEMVRATFVLTPKGMIETLKLRRPIYRKTAAFGHFGRTEETFTWEATDKAKALKEASHSVAAAAKLSGAAVQSSLVNSHSKGWLFCYANGSTIRIVKVRDLIRMVESDGWKQVRTTGSHRHFKHSSKPNVVTIPVIRATMSLVGTMKSILRAAGLEEKK